MRLDNSGSSPFLDGRLGRKIPSLGKTAGELQGTDQERCAYHVSPSRLPVPLDKPKADAITDHKGVAKGLCARFPFSAG